MCSGQLILGVELRTLRVEHLQEVGESGLESLLRNAGDGIFEVEGLGHGNGEMNVVLVAGDVLGAFALAKSLLPADRPWRAAYRPAGAGDFEPLASRDPRRY